jgi:uncharacterized membrane protein YcaP (DUF421 family)
MCVPQAAEDRFVSRSAIIFCLFFTLLKIKVGKQSFSQLFSMAFYFSFFAGENLRAVT